VTRCGDRGELLARAFADGRPAGRASSLAIDGHHFDDHRAPGARQAIARQFEGAAARLAGGSFAIGLRIGAAGTFCRNFGRPELGAGDPTRRPRVTAILLNRDLFDGDAVAASRTDRNAEDVAAARTFGTLNRRSASDRRAA
jgi:hypothetical protein